MKTPICIRPATPEEAAKAEQRRATVDRYGELDRRADLAKPDEAEAAILKSEIQGWYKETPADKGASAQGDLYRVNLTAKRDERTLVDKRKAFNILTKRLGMDGLIAVITLPLTVIDANFTTAEQESLCPKTRSGYRTLSVVAMQAAGELQKAA
jgi:hypothetical protein